MPDKDQEVFFLYVAGLNPTKSTEQWNQYGAALLGTAGQTISSAKAGIESSIEHTVRAMEGIRDPEEAFLRFRAKFKDELTGDKEISKKDLRKWVEDQAFWPDVASKIVEGSPLGLIDVGDNTRPLLGTEGKDSFVERILSTFDEHIQTGKELNEIRRTKKNIQNATRDIYDQSGFKGLTLKTTNAAVELSAAIASNLVVPGGAFAYGAVRVFGETTEDMLDHGASPEEARFIALIASGFSATLEAFQANVAIPQSSMKIFGQQFIKAIKDKEYKISGFSS